MPVLLLGYFCARERSSGRRRGLRDCSRVRVTSTARYVGQMAPDERRAAKVAGRQLQLRPATWQKRVSVDNADSRIVLHSLGIIPRRPAAFLPNDLSYWVAYDLLGSGMPLSARMAPSI